MKDEFVIKKSMAYTASLVIVAFVIGIFVGRQFFVPSSTGGNNPTTTVTQPIQIKLDIPSFVPFKGTDSAKINIIEFGDYQCPFCGRFYQQTEPDLIKKYVDTGKTKFYFMDFAFLGPDSLTLGDGAWCANDQGKYYNYHDYVYSIQGQENSGWATADKVKAFVGNITGIDVKKFSSCLDAKTYDSRVQQLTQLGQPNGVSGTPTFFIGNSQLGYVGLVGAQPISAFQQVVDSQLSKA